MPTNHFLSFTLVVSFSFPLALFGQTDLATLSGRVTDRQDQPLPGITVLLDDTRGVATKTDGRFIIPNVAPGKHTLSVSGVGYATQTFPLSLTAGQTKQPTIRLEEGTTEMDEVIVTGQSEATKLRQSAQAVAVIETQVARLQTADLGEVMAQVQGVNVRRSGGLGSATRFALNGLTDDQIRFFLDGIPLDFVGYSFGIANVPVNLIDRVEIYKGVVPVRFGADALGGAVNLVSPEGFLGTGGSVSYQVGSFGTHRTALSVQHQPDSSGFFVQASAFYDRARNNYEVDVEVPDERGRLSAATVPRFHDTYEAMGVNGEVGVRNRP